MTRGFAALFKRLGEDGVWDIVDKCVLPEVRGIFQKSDDPYSFAGPAVSDIQGLRRPTEDELHQPGVYVSIVEHRVYILDKGRYVGSATATLDSSRGIGLGARWMDYELSKKRANRSGSSQGKGRHLRYGTQLDHAWFLRLVATFPLGTPKAFVLLVEGLICDLFSTVTGDEIKADSSYHTPEMAKAAENARPQTRFGPSWQALNRCSPFGQGVAGGSIAVKNQQLAKQDGKCACCSQPGNDGRDTWFIWNRIPTIDTRKLVCDTCGRWERFELRQNSWSDEEIAAQIEFWRKTEGARLAGGYKRLGDASRKTWQAWTRQNEVCAACNLKKRFDDGAALNKSSPMRTGWTISKLACHAGTKAICVTCYVAVGRAKDLDVTDVDSSEQWCKARKDFKAQDDLYVVRTEGVRQRFAVPKENAAIGQSYICPYCKRYLPGFAFTGTKDCWFFPAPAKTDLVADLGPGKVMCSKCYDSARTLKDLDDWKESRLAWGLENSL